MKTGWVAVLLIIFLFVTVHARCPVRYLDIIYQLDGFPRSVCNVNNKIIKDGEIADIMCHINCLCTDGRLTCCDRSKRLCQGIDDNCQAVVFNFNTRQIWFSTVNCKREIIQYWASGSSDNESIEPPPPPPEEHPLEPLKIAIDPEPERRVGNSVPDSSNLDGNGQTVPPRALVDPSSLFVADSTHSPDNNKDSIPEEVAIPSPVVNVPPINPVISGKVQPTPKQADTKAISREAPKQKSRRKTSTREARIKAQERIKKRKEGRRRLEMQKRAGRLTEFRRRQEEKKRAFLKSVAKANLDLAAKKKSRRLQIIKKQKKKHSAKLAAQKKRKERQAARLAKIAERKKRRLAYLKKKADNKRKREERRKKKAEKAKRRAANLIKQKSNLSKRKRRQMLRVERFKKRQAQSNP